MGLGGAMQVCAGVVLAVGVLAGCAGATAPPSPDAGGRVVALARPEAVPVGPGAAPNAPPPGGVDPAFATDLALRVFFDLCARHPTDEAARIAWLRRSNFAPMPPGPATPALPGHPGTTWMRMDPPSVAVPMAVVTSATGWTGCAVLGPLSDPERAAVGFARLAEGLARPGLLVRKDRDEARPMGGRPGRFLLYRVGVPPLDEGGFHFALSARRGATTADGLSLLMTAGRAGRG